MFIRDRSEAPDVKKSPAQNSSSNSFDVLEEEVQDSCKVCGKGFKHILKHLGQAAKCRKEYGSDYDQLKEDKRKGSRKKFRDEQKKIDEAAFLRDDAERKRKERDARKKIDGDAFLRSEAERIKIFRDERKQIDEDALHRDEAERKKK